MLKEELFQLDKISLFSDGSLYVCALHVVLT